MKKAKLIVWLVAVALVAIAFGCATPQNTNTATMPAVTPEATPDKAAIVAELTRIENDWPRIIKEKDGAAVRRIEADDAVIVYPDGSVGGKEQDIKDIEEGNLTYESWNISEVNVKVLDADSAVVHLAYNVTNGKYKTTNISGYYRSVDTFARRGGQWQLVASATTPVPHPTSTPTPSSATASPMSSPAAKPSPTRRTPPPPPANQ
jgi:ketosteroid isomerase-like protein